MANSCYIMVGVDSAVPPAAWTHYIKIPESMQLTATTERGRNRIVISPATVNKGLNVKHVHLRSCLAL